MVIIKSKDKKPEKPDPKSLKASLNEAMARFSTSTTGGLDENLDAIYGKGWSQRTKFDSNEDFSSRARKARMRSRAAYYKPNLFFEAGVETKLAYILGHDFSIGELYDEDANDILQEFVRKNDFNTLVQDSLILEMLIDGEIAIVIDKENSPLGEVPKVGILNADAINKVVGNHIDGVTEIHTTIDKQEVIYELGEFVFWAHKANFRNLRGYPTLEGARQAADEIIYFINNRLRLSDIQSRLNMVWTHLLHEPVDEDDPDVWDQRQSHEAGAVSLPPDGVVIHKYKDPVTGHTEEIEFLEPAKTAADASKDYEVLRKAFAFSVPVADFAMGYGGDVNRATAEVIAEVLVKRYQPSQAKARRFISDVCRMAIERADSRDVNVSDPDSQSEMLYEIEVKNAEGNDEVEEVTIDKLPIPMNIPNLQTDSLEEKLKMFEFARSLGYEADKILKELGLS